MSIFKNISATSTTLMEKTVYAGRQFGVINNIYINNNHDTNPCTVSIWLAGSPNYYIVKNLVIPVGTGLNLDRVVNFDITTHTLKIDTSASPNLTVIID